MAVKPNIAVAVGSGSGKTTPMRSFQEIISFLGLELQANYSVKNEIMIVDYSMHRKILLAAIG